MPSCGFPAPVPCLPVPGPAPCPGGCSPVKPQRKRGPCGPLPVQPDPYSGLEHRHLLHLLLGEQASLHDEGRDPGDLAPVEGGAADE